MARSISIQQGARRMIQLYKGEAEAEAAGRANALADIGDIEGCRFWTRMTQAIVMLSMKTGSVH